MSTFASGTITVSNATPGQSVAINIAPQQGFAWSSGNPSDPNNSGITLSTTSGSPVPVNSFSMTNQVMQTITASGGSSSGSSTISFSIATYISNANTGGYVGMSCTADPGVTVTFAFSNSKSVTLTSAQVGVMWPS